VLFQAAYTWSHAIDDSTAECEKALARYADDPDMMLTGVEREAIKVVRAVLAAHVRV